ncbi:unnamed protein product [Adineta ricciae]|uniref:Uncharacterized protein n=2 Tax=Adineta ricciae TaxID=249248 RepID=A0A813PL29_ADIRI|nr:unnamed protein product [Adineta ricciae]
MLLSNPKIDYSTVRRMPTVKLSGQTQGSTMPTSTSLQDINAHTQKFAWNSSTEKDDRLVHFSGQLLSTNSVRRLSTSQSDERIFEHPEVTIKPSALDDEIQKRLLTMKPSNTNENLIERDGGRSAPNILEHPDMRAPVVMLSQQLSSSSTSSLIQCDLKRVTRTQSAEPPSTTTHTLSPARDDVKFYLDDRDNFKRSTSPGDTNKNSNSEKNENLASLTKVSLCEPEEGSSKLDVHLLSARKNESW